jgi:uncharacterized membrane-anchored protein YitT (DUF2179 family)
MRRPNYRNAGLFLVLVAAALAYIPINQAAGGASSLAGSLDKHLPTLPLFVVPYLLFLAVFWLTLAYSLITGHDFLRLILAAIAVYVASDLFYLVYQTYMPRPQHITSGLLDFVYRHDRPYCDVPSQHAASAVIFALYWWSYGGRIRWITASFAGSVIAATVLIKQHSVAGMLSGVVLGVAAWFLVTRKLGQRKTA